jgi:hypothetical protein
MSVEVQLTLIRCAACLIAITIICGLIYALSQTKIWERITLKCKVEKGMYFEFGAEKDQAVKKSE